MSGQKTSMFNIAVAPDRLSEAVRSNLEKLRADDERIRRNLDRIFETERRLHSTFHRITREIAGRTCMDDILRAQEICNPALRPAGFQSVDRLQELFDQIDRSSLPWNTHPLLSPEPSSQPEQEDAELKPSMKEPPAEPADEPLPEHVGPVVTSFDQALYLIGKGLL